MTVVDVQVQLFKTHGKQMHDITNVQVENPVILQVLYSKDSLHVVFQLGKVGATALFALGRVIVCSSCTVVCALIQLSTLFLLL